MRTVAIYQSADQGGHTVFYELARAVFDSVAVTLDAWDNHQYEQWTSEGIWSAKEKIYVTPSDGQHFLDVLRDDFSKGGRTFALDSARGDEVPPSLFNIRTAIGNERSGNWGHSGRPGEVGGSSSEGRSISREVTPEEYKKHPKDADGVIISGPYKGYQHTGNTSHGELILTKQREPSDPIPPIKKESGSKRTKYIDPLDFVPSKSRDPYEIGVGIDKLIKKYGADWLGQLTKLHEKGLVPALIRGDLDSMLKVAERTVKHPPTRVHHAADKYRDRVKLAVHGAFVNAREAVNVKRLRAAKTEAEATAALEPAVAALKAGLAQTLTPSLLACLGAGGEAGARLLKSLRTAGEFRTAKTVDFTFDHTDTAAVKWAQKHAGELIEDITKTSRKRIAKAIVEVLEGDESFEDAVDRIADEIGDESRAENIARSETMRAANYGQRAAWDQAAEKGLLTGNEQRTWIATDDEAVCPVCEGLDGSRADLDGEYPNLGVTVLLNIRAVGVRRD